MNVSKTIVSVETFALLLKRNGNKTMFVDGYQQNRKQVWLHLTTCSFVIKFINKKKFVLLVVTHQKLFQNSWDLTFLFHF